MAIFTGTEKPINPFKALREKQKAAQADIKAEQDVTSLITLGDVTVQNLLKEQSDPLSLQEKLKALFSADIKTDDPFPINAKQLYEFLNVTTRYNDWFPRNAEKAELDENIDYKTVLKDEYRADGTLMPQKGKEHWLTLDAAKEITMVQKSALGKLVRKYLIWAEKKLHEVITVQQEQRPTDILDIMGMAVQALKDIRDKQQQQQLQLDQVSKEQKLISDKVNSLEAANKIEKPAAVISKRCKVLNGLTTKLVEQNILTYQQSKQECYSHVLTEFGLDLDQELEKYKTACRRYYEHYKIYKGTPPKDVLRPAAIENLGWISYVSTDLEIYNNVRIFLESYLNEE